MKGNKEFLALAVVHLIANISFATMAEYTQIWSLQFIVVISGCGASFFAFLFGKQEERGFVLAEHDLPREIYQVVAIVMHGSFAVALLRGKNRKILACESKLMGGNFSCFNIVNSEDGKFFVPVTMGSLPTPALDTSLPRVGMAG